MHVPIAAIVFMIAVVPLTIFALTRKHAAAPCVVMIAGLYQRQLQGLDGLVTANIDGGDYWQLSHGLSGLWRRWHNHSIMVRICQSRAEVDRSVTAEDLEYVLSRAAQMSRASFAAAFFGVLHWVVPVRASRAGRFALALYRDIAYQTHAMLANSDAHMCASQLQKIL